jgi:DNA-binding HxlR family transcriptional regulator
VKLQKETNGDAADRRRYDDACAAAHGMDLIGERWAMPVIRELLMGPRRFSDLKNSLNGISAKVLTERLEGLENAGILGRRKLAPPANVQVYELTPWGYESAPIFQALGRWATRSPRHDPSRPFSPVSLMLSLRTMFKPAAADGARGRLNLRLSGSLSSGRWRTESRHRPGRDCGCGRDDRRPADRRSQHRLWRAPAGGRYRDRDLAITGDLDLVRQLPGFFPLPAPATDRIS